MKRILLGVCQNKDVHLQQISKDKWSSYMKMESQEQRLRESMNLVHLPSIAGLSKRKRQARFLKKITEPRKRMSSSLFLSEFSGLKWRMIF